MPRLESTKRSAMAGNPDDCDLTSLAAAERQTQAGIVPPAAISARRRLHAPWMVRLVSVVVIGLVLATNSAVAQRRTPALVRLEVGTSKAIELERNPKTSTIAVSHQKGARLGSVGSSMFVMRAFYDVAKARGFEYAINLKEWTNQDGRRIYIAGFTNKRGADPKAEFGAEYDLVTEQDPASAYFSVSELDLLFAQQEAPARDPAAGAPKP